jgi:hypothetical protein
VLHALARWVAGTAAETLHAQATLEHPPAPLPGYHIAEITITGGSPPAGRKLGDVSWPLASIPVSVLRAGSVHPASRGIHPGSRGPRQPAGPRHPGPAASGHGTARARTRTSRQSTHGPERLAQRVSRLRLE